MRSDWDEEYEKRKRSNKPKQSRAKAPDRNPLFSDEELHAIDEALAVHPWTFSPLGQSAREKCVRALSARSDGTS